MKIKLSSDNELSLNKTVEIPTITIGYGRNIPQVFLDECLYKI